MSRKIAVILTMLLCSMATHLYALGLGAVTVESALNQPLRVQIELLQLGDTRLQDVRVQMASNDDFLRFNIKRADFLSNVRFSVESTPQGNIVVLTTSQIVRESYLSFILDTRWPNGRSLSEYTILLDLPVFDEQGSAAEPEQAETQGAGTIETGTGDTLSAIALQVRPDSAVSLQQTMLAIQLLNPDAFTDGNINRLRTDQVLRVPTLKEIEAIDVRDAVDEVRRQNRDFAGVDTQPLAVPADAVPAQDDEPQGQLSVVAADDAIDASDGSAQSASVGNEALDQRIVELETQLAQRQEEADRATIKREELDSRMQDLESQIVAAQEIIRLQDIQLLQLQQSLAAAAEPEASQPPASPASFFDDVVRLLTGNNLAMLFAVVLVILLLVGLMLRRNRATTLADDEGERDEIDQQALEDGGGEAAVENEISEESQEKVSGDDVAEVETEDSDAEDDDALSFNEEIEPDIDDKVARNNSDADSDEVTGAEIEDAGDDDLEFLPDAELEIESVEDVEEGERLSDDDEIMTKLELAYAYQKMGDTEGAKEILQEVISQGSEEQIEEANKLLGTFDDNAE